MGAPPIRRLVARRYGCLSDVDIGLTRLHAFIGPNDSGKSTILRAVRTVVQFAWGRFREAAAGEMISAEPYPTSPFDPGFPESPIAPSSITGWYSEDRGYRIEKTGDKHEESIVVDLDDVILGPFERRVDHLAFSSVTEDEFHHIDAADLQSAFRGARLVRFDAEACRAPSRLIPESELVDKLDESGGGLPGIYDALLGRNPDAFFSIREEVRRLFPAVDTIQNPAATSDTKELRVKLRTGESVPPAFVSDGLLYYLAFSCLQYIEPVSVLLVEEPENGLHPARISDIVRMLRETSRTTQVLIATHSPLVVNELKPDEVSVVRRFPDRGSVVIPMRETVNLEERLKVYALGELWLSYADGDLEAPLFSTEGEN